MGVCVTTVAKSGQTVVTLEGVADAALLARLMESIAVFCTDSRIVLDLTDVALASPAVIARLIGHLRSSIETGRLRVVCGRLSGRQLLRRFGDNSLVFYPSVADALMEPACA